MYQMILRIPTELKEQLKKAADERGQTLTGLIRQILWEWAEEITEDK
jgi:predicted DNA-binding protein|nr:MAG TPA: hypothetical protein [Caudoviricetes sp.]